MKQAPALLSNRNFLLLWLASIVSNFALAVAMLAETWLVINTLGAKEQLGLVMIAGSVPRILLMAVGGVLADRIKRSHIILASVGLRVLLLFAMIPLLAAGKISMGIMIVFALIYGALDAFFWPARDALVPNIVADNDLTRANSIMLTTNQIGLVFGPVLGGAMLALFSYEVVFALTGIMLALGLIAIAMIHEPALLAGRARFNMLAELKEGVQYAIQTPVLRALMLVYAAANLLFMGPLGLGIPIIVTDLLQGNASTLSFMQSAFAAGMVLGGLLLTLYPPSKKRLLMITVVIAIEGLLLATLALANWLPLALALQVLIGLGVAANNIPMMSLIQHYTERQKLGRIMSLNSMASMGLAPLSYALVTGLFSMHIGIEWVLPVFGLLLAAMMGLMTLKMRVIREVD
ncbi:MFS transporter [Iodobacter sp. CM08]|uniref:MFS transporter n=1 Tax=Iodobacter sp. CM08 TaxID=3085902 RepID=UPI002982740F|nr:MFS transporter [Iodobacter sp. CM08]MDW5415028.1 MFS transporter [Iodobacter sp. CM08]